MQANMGQQYGNYAGNPTNMMQANMQGNQQLIQGAQGGIFPGQQQNFGQPRPPQPDYRGMAQNQRPQYIQQAPNVTMNTMGAMGGAQGGPAPPYTRGANQGMQANVQAQQNQFQQQRMRQQMLAMQQQQQQGGQGALVAHLRQMNPNPYHNQPPAYNMG